MASSFSAAPKKTTTHNMTSGSIVRQIILFSLPLMFGNIFQMLYNTVDSIVVGKFVSTQALAAVGSTTMIINMLVFFFNGFSIGAGVTIGREFGANNMKRLKAAIQTTMATTFILCVLFTIIGVLWVSPMLRVMDTPEDVIPEATTYLRIYFLGISGLLIYNMGSGILRAVGDTTRPLYFLVLTSVLNILLDLLFVLAFGMGIEGVALATIISQFISAGLTLFLLVRTNDIYKLSLKPQDLKIDKGLLKEIFRLALPAGIQSVITAFSNIFVQSYINYFGSACMAGWSCYNKLDSFIMLPMQSMAMAATTFVSQNIGAGKTARANRGTFITIGLCFSITAVMCTFLFTFAETSVTLFSDDPEVIRYGALFLHYNVFFFLTNCITHTLAGALRGRGDSTGPMVAMLMGFVVVRQIYLFVVTHFIVNSEVSVGFGYPVGWMASFLFEIIYFYFRFIRKQKQKLV